VGLFCINYDEGLKGLRDELTYKFAVADTVYLRDSIIRRMPDLSFLQKATRYLALYGYILQNPCVSCFENDATSADDEQVIVTYMRELKIDSLIKARKRMKAADAVSLKDKFDFVNKQLTTYLKFTALFFLLVSAGFICFYIAGLRYNGDNWHLKKIVAFILILSSTLFVFAAFAWCFTSDRIPLFGVSRNSVPGGGECTTDPYCINIPFSTLLLIIIAGVFIGFLLFRYFISPLLKEQDIP
jgi:hypothetical protein